MTTQRTERIPALTLGWRLKMALGDMKRDDMADALGVNPATVSRWMADKGAAPKRAYLAQWALMTQVPVEWLESGVESEGPEGPDGGDRKPSDQLARLTDQKRSRSRVTDTRRYLSASALAA